MRRFFALLIVALVLPVAAAPARRPASGAAKPSRNVARQALTTTERSQAAQRVYIGTYTNSAGLPPGVAENHGEGIYIAESDGRTGALSTPILVAKTPSPAALLFDPAHGVLYAANTYEGFLDPRVDHGVGTVSAFRVDPATGALAFIGAASAGGLPVSLAFDSSGHYVLCANVDSLAALPIRPDGSAGDYNELARTGERTQIGDLVIDPTGHFVLAADSGASAILEFAFDASTGKFSQIASLPQDAAPRRLAFNAKGDLLYALSQDARLTVYTFDLARGSLRPRQTLSALLPDYAGASLGTALLFSKDGRQLYAASALSDTIASFSVAKDGSVKALSQISAGGAVTRAALLAPDGRHIFALARQADSIAAFALDAGGAPKRPALFAAVPSPAAMVFAVK